MKRDQDNEGAACAGVSSVLDVVTPEAGQCMVMRDAPPRPDQAPAPGMITSGDQRHRGRTDPGQDEKEPG